jgi:hypothetical protein
MYSNMSIGQPGFHTNTKHRKPCNNNNNNSVVLVRERTIPTERPPLVGEVSTKFCG